MIDSSTEDLMSFDEAGRYAGRACGRGPLSEKTLYRWSSQGLRGVVLETMQVGGKRATSRAALHRFFLALDQARKRRGQVDAGLSGKRAGDGSRAQRRNDRDGRRDRPRSAGGRRRRARDTAADVSTQLDQLGL